MIFSNNAEGGVAGNLPTTTDGGSGDDWTTVTRTDASGVLEYTDVWSAHGRLGYRYASRSVASQETLAVSGAAAASQFGRFGFMCDVTPTGTTRVLQMKATAAGNVGGYLSLNTTRALSIRTSAEASAYTFTNLLTAGATYRIEVNAIANNTTTVTWQVRLSLGDSMRLIEDSGVVNVTNAGSIATFAYAALGQTDATLTNRPSTTGFCCLDDPAFAEAGWIGPAVTDLGTPVDRRNFIYLRRSI